MFTKRVVYSLFLLALTTLLIACSGSTETGSPSAQEVVAGNSSITVVGQGQAFGEPDRAQVMLGVDIFAETVSEATSQNEETIQRIMAALTDQGIAREDIQTANYSLWAEQIYGDRGPEGIAGYRVTNQINATIRDIGQVSDVLAAVIEAGANSIHGVSFSVSDPAELKAEARTTAMADARQRAQSLAELAGLELGEIQEISEVIGQPVQPLIGLGGGASAEAAVPSISPGQLSHQVQVQVTFGIE